MITIDGVIGYGTPLRGVTETFAAQVVGLRGPNGSGKSTLLRTLAGLVPLVEGTVSIDGRVVDGAQFVQPEDRLVRYVDRDVYPGGALVDFLGFPLRCAGVGRTQRDRTVSGLIEEFGLGDLASLSVAEMSQGQLARVTIARAFAGESRAILLDEPFRGLDESNRESMTQILRERARAVGVPVVVVSHDADDLARLCARVVTFD